MSFIYFIYLFLIGLWAAEFVAFTRGAFRYNPKIHNLNGKLLKPRIEIGKFSGGNPSETSSKIYWPVATTYNSLDNVDLEAWETPQTTWFSVNIARVPGFNTKQAAYLTPCFVFHSHMLKTLDVFVDKVQEFQSLSISICSYIAIECITSE